MQGFWDSLPAEEKSQAENEAIAQASKIERDVLKRGGALSKLIRRRLESYSLKAMQPSYTKGEQNIFPKKHG